MEFSYDTFCGLYCGACPVTVAMKNNKLDEFAKQHNYKPEDLECYGCKVTQTLAKSDRCGIMDCAISKNLESCHLCDEYPCTRLRSFKEDKHPHHSAIFKNLDQLREIGLDSWLSEQATRWNCKACGEGFAWYDEKCKKCGATLFNCREEERELK